MTFPQIPKLLLLLVALLLMAGCGGPKKAGVVVLPRDYKDHDPFVRVDPQIYTDNEMGWIKVDDNTQRKVYFNDRLTLEVVKKAKSELKKDIKTDYSFHDRIGYVMQGGAIVTVARNTKQIGAGGAFVIPSNVPFNVIPAADNTLLLYAYTPPRDDLRPTAPIGLRFNENEIRSFVYRWFGLYDEKAEAVALMYLLAPDGLRMEFADKTVVNSPAEFANVYNAWSDAFVTSFHNVEQVNVEMDPGNGQYRVRIVFSWTGTMRDGKTTQRRFQDDWVIQDSSSVDVPRITSFTEKDLKADQKGGQKADPKQDQKK